MFGFLCGSSPGCFLLVSIFLSVVLLVGGKINSEFFWGGGGWKVKILQGQQRKTSENFLVFYF